LSRSFSTTRPRFGGKSVQEFEQSVLFPYLGSRDMPLPATLRDFLVAEFPVETEGDEAAEDAELRAISVAAEIEAALEESLRSGRFILVVAAPQIPIGVQSVIR
jgi:hypothetical protein